MRTKYVLSLIVLSIALIVSADGAGNFNLESTVLYQPDRPLRERLRSAEELAAYVLRLDTAASAFFASEKTPERLDIVVGLKPGKKVRVWFVSSRRPSQDKSLIALRRKLEAVPSCTVRGNIAFCASLHDCRRRPGKIRRRNTDTEGVARCGNEPPHPRWYLRADMAQLAC